MEGNVLIMGAGHQGLAMAAHLTLTGEKVNLWNRTPENIDDVSASRVIHCKGAVNGTAQIENVSSNIEDVIANRIMVTTPAFAHKSIAKLIAPLVSDDTLIILNPGRTFGAEDFSRELVLSGCNSSPIIAETQTIVYTCRRDAKNFVNIYALKKNVLIATVNQQHLKTVLEGVPTCLKPFILPAHSTVQTSIGNVGMILHCAPVLLNIGWIEYDVADFKFYCDGISPGIARFLEKMDDERISVGKAMGYNLETTVEWLKRSYGVSGTNLYECIKNNKYYKDIYAPKNLDHRYISEDLPYGLVPLESAANYYDIPTPCVSTIIDIASIVMDVDYRKTGRKFSLLS